MYLYLGEVWDLLLPVGDVCGMQSVEEANQGVRDVYRQLSSQFAEVRLQDQVIHEFLQLRTIFSSQSSWFEVSVA